jgi:hypothetical protein
MQAAVLQFVKDLQPGQLLDLAIELLRLAPKLHAPQLGDLQLQVFDCDAARGQLLLDTLHRPARRRQPHH